MKTKLINGETFVCPRPAYHFPKFDVSLQRQAFISCGELIYNQNRRVLVEDDGKQWFHDSLVAPKIVDFLISNISHYHTIIQKRFNDYKEVKRITEEAALLLKQNYLDKITLAHALDNLCKAYILTLQSVVVANLVVEDIYKRYEELIYKLLPILEANRYLASTIQCPAARLAAEMRFFEDTRGTKRIQDVKSEPVQIFADPVFFVSHPLDGELSFKSVKSGIPLDLFWGIRFAAPMTIQFCEEFRYADYSIRTHLKYCLKKINSILGGNINLYEMEYQKVLSLLMLNNVRY